MCVWHGICGCVGLNDLLWLSCHVGLLVGSGGCGGCELGCGGDGCTSILISKRTRDEHPLLLVVEDVVGEVVEAMVREGTTETMHAMVEAMLFRQHVYRTSLLCMWSSSACVCTRALCVCAACVVHRVCRMSYVVCAIHGRVVHASCVCCMYVRHAWPRCLTSNSSPLFPVSCVALFLLFYLWFCL